MILFTRLCILVCDVPHEWVLYLFCVIAMCDSNVSTLQIASKPIASCEQFYKNTCIKLLLHAEQIALCEWTFKWEVSHSSPASYLCWNTHVGRVNCCYDGHIHQENCYTRGKSQGIYITMALTSENLAVCSGFHNKMRCHQKLKTGVSVAP